MSKENEKQTALAGDPQVPNARSIKDDESSRRQGVWIVVPTLNEAKNILHLLNGIYSEMVGVPYYVCLVDDGSRDGTLDQVRFFTQSRRIDNIHIIRREKRYRGSQRGAAVLAGLRYGLQHSNCRVFVEIDADLSHSPRELRTGIHAIGALGFDVAIASKYMAKSRILNRPWTRRSLSFTYNWLLRRLVNSKIRDYSNGYRFYDRRCIEIICAHRIKYGSPIHLVETLAILLASGMHVLEFPSTYVGRGEGVSKLRWMDIIKAGAAMFEISARYHLNRLDRKY